ncbi:MAG: TRAP transporter substrate-binding protein DctP [Proteobacteria bacterium]|nr:TRAP transporter substrate-binding protein DctP [Pseudomonadota bacterium]MBU4576197.1 TRAP transporter substrate-binding protein DctP [Pseudomonadota bacterium]MBU4597093.1 TRAP transporter substrate-binding protein DctP [Pseudomonadota bacterium]MBV1715335.1 TRAP transporter substrate-binding protein DctP [Desulfarculus sp.]
MRYFADQVAKESGGALKCQLFFAGQILKTKEAFSALQKGMVDGLYSALLYYGGIVKEASWEWLPFTWQDPSQVVDLYYNRGLLQVMEQALAAHRVHYLGAIPMGTLGFLTKFDVKQLADFKGKKIRASGPQASVVKLLGATPVSLAAAEQYTALQRGTIEGTIYPWYTVGAYKFYEVIDYIVTPGVYSPCVIDVMMGLKSWKRLSDTERQAIARATRNTVEWAARQNNAWDQEGLTVTKEHKVKILKLSSQEVKQLRAATKPMWDQVAARSELSGKAVKILREFLNEK